MPDIAITYRTAGPWGAGKGARLTNVEVDQDMYALATAIMALQDDRPQPAEIASITVSGRYMTINLTNGLALGPFPLPITEFRFRDEWTPLTIYAPLDWFTVAGVGIFSVMYAHTSGAEFDPNLLVDTLPALKKLFGPDAGSIANAQVYDIEFIYAGRLSDIVDPLNFLALRSITIPSSAVHRAYIGEAPASQEQVLPILHGAGEIGRAIFAVGENTGTVVIDADETLAPGDRLAIGPPVVTDGVAAVMSIAFAAQRALAS